MKFFFLVSSVVLYFLRYLNYVTATTNATEDDRSTRQDPVYHVGRFVEQITKPYNKSLAKFMPVQHIDKPCFGTVINFSSYYVVTTCSCAVQIDRAPVSFNKLNENFDKRHTKIVPSTEDYYFEHIEDLDSPGDQLHKNRNKVLLVIRHPRCHMENQLFHWNIAVVRVEKEFHVEYSYIKAEFNQSMGTAVLRMFSIAARTDETCYTYYVDGKTLQLTRCNVWSDMYELWPREPEKDIYEQGTMCLDHATCGVTLGTPVCCGEHKNCYGIVSGNCWDCMNIHIVYINMIYRNDFHLTDIDDAWEQKLQDKGDTSDLFRQFWTWKPKRRGPDWPYGPTKSASSSIASFSLINLFKKSLKTWSRMVFLLLK